MDASAALNEVLKLHESLVRDDNLDTDLVRATWLPILEGRGEEPDTEPEPSESDTSDIEECLDEVALEERGRFKVGDKGTLPSQDGLPEETFEVTDVRLGDDGEPTVTCRLSSNEFAIFPESVLSNTKS